MAKQQEGNDNKATRCGIGNYRPDWLQVLNNPFVLCALLGIYILNHGAIATGIQSVNITSLERRFRLSSVQIGWILSAVHISAATVGTLASFYATSHKPRWLALGAIVGSIGLLIYGSPHFLTGPYDPRGQHDDWNLCKPNRTTCADAEDTGLSNYMYFLMLGNFLCGFSGSTILTVGISLIDDILPANTAPLYIGLVNALWFVGMAIGYVVGGQALKLYVDFDTVPSESLSIEPSDVRWVGAWWLSIFVGSVVYALLFLTFSLYGSELQSAMKRRSEKNTSSEDTTNRHLGEESTQRSIKAFLPVLFRILKSPVVVFLNISVALIYLFQSPVGFFVPKIFQNQYNQSAATSGLLAGISILPGVAIGQFLGGFITKQLGLKIRGCFCLAMLCAIFAFPGSFVWLLYCHRTEVYGLDASYSISNKFSAVPVDNQSSILSSCNQDCSCRSDVYQPICDSSARHYYSPCYAGCTAVIKQESNEVYTNCSCLPGQNNSLVLESNICDKSCDTIYYAMPIMFTGVISLTVVYFQVQTLILRLHEEEDKAFALGIMWLFIRILGMIPGPLLLGTVLDKACDVWGKSCAQEVTSCLIYDNQLAARNLSLCAGSITLGLVLSVMTAFIIYKVSKRSKVSAE